ncbi:MAG: hypothetical protein JXB39_04125 [Deltaproteobacteria bacterium]|nr:hypothetical protein [Deltaproteobacteria bacterium]
MLAIASSLLAIHVAVADPSGPVLCLVLPSGHAGSDWSAAVELAGMRLGDAGCEATAELTATRGCWRLTVHTPDGAVLRPADRFPVPSTEDEREALVWLIHSLLHPVKGLLASGDTSSEPQATVVLEASVREPPPAPPAPVPPGPTPAPPAPLDPPIPDSPRDPPDRSTPDSPLPASTSPKSRILEVVPPEPAPAVAEPAASEPDRALGPQRLPVLFAEIGTSLASRGGSTDSVAYRATFGWVSRGRHLRCGIAADLPTTYAVDVLGRTRTMDAREIRAGAWWRPGGLVGAVGGGLVGLSWRTFIEDGAEIDARVTPMLGLEGGFSLSFGSRWSVLLEPRLHVGRDLVDTAMTVDGVSAGPLDPWLRGMSLGLLVVFPVNWADPATRFVPLFH